MRLTPGILLLVVPLLAGCRGESFTIRQLGHPAFDEVVGAETRYWQVDPKQERGMDVYPEGIDEDANHGFLVRFWPLGTLDQVILKVTARPKGRLALKRLAMAAFPVTRQEAQTFERFGTLPAADQPLKVSTEVTEEDGWLVQFLTLDRSEIPAKTVKLAIPTLAEFADGWIYVRYYHTSLHPTINSILSN